MSAPETAANPMAEIEALAKSYADARETLLFKARHVQFERARLLEHHLPTLRQLAGAAERAEKALMAKLRANPELFKRPKSRVLHGIRVGWRKLKGKLSWNDDAQVVARIERHFPDRFGVLVKTVRTPQKDALAKLPAQELKRLGVSIGDDDDEVLIKPVDGEAEKLVKTLLDGDDA